jgi:hypothetical protein
MYATLSVLSKAEFVHLLKTMKTNPLLEDFKVRMQNARKNFKTMTELCSSK